MKNAFSYRLKSIKSLVLAVGAAVLTASVAHAQDSGALIDALVKKGVLSDQEAEDIRVDLTKEYNTTSAGKIELSSFISHLKLFGDARLRYNYSNAQTYSATPAPAGGPASGHVNNNDESQYRWRLRLGAEYTYDPHWSAVVRLETATGNDSTNTDFGNYFDKTANTIYVGQVYLRYQNQFSLFDSTSTVANGKNFNTVTDPGVDAGVDIVVGRGPSQITLSEAFWDEDLNPDGLAEQFTFKHVGVEGLTLAARGAEYITSDNSTNGLATVVGGNSTTSSTSKNESAYLFIAQLEAKYEFAPKTNVVISPLFLTETPGTYNGIATTLPEQSGNDYATSNTNLAVLGGLNVVAIPLEFNFPLFGQPNKVYGTYGANLTPVDRLQRIEGFPGEAGGGVAAYANQHGQNSFFNAGYQIGELKKKGDWQLSAEYRWIEALSYTPNLSDSDWANGVLGQQGVALKAAYSFTDFLTANVIYYHSNPIRPEGGDAVGAVNGIYGSTGAEGQADIIQGNLNWKF